VVVSKLSICEIYFLLRDAGMILPEGASLGDVALPIKESFMGRGTFKVESVILLLGRSPSKFRRKRIYTKLRFSSTTCSFFHEDLLFFVLSETYLERDSIIYCARLQFHEDSFYTSHFDYECFVIIKTFLRRSFDNLKRHRLE
jgi:hypothetical protein